MHTVLLKNKSHELMTLNVGDAGVTIVRTEATQNSKGSVGTKTTRKQVSSSVTLLPGESKRVSGIILKQRTVQRLRDKGDLSVIEQVAEEAPLATSPIVAEAASPLPSARGSHPVVEEGTIGVEDLLKAKRSKQSRSDR